LATFFIVLLSIWYFCDAMPDQENFEGKETTHEQGQLSLREEVAGVGLSQSLVGGDEADNAIEGFIFMQTLDTGIADSCQNPSIYMVLWAARGPALDTFLAVFVSLALQTFLPLLIFPLSGPVRLDLKKTMPNKIVATAYPFILVYTFLTLKSSANRVLVMLALAGASGKNSTTTTTSWARTLPLVTGCLAVWCCICFTLTSTVYLFLEQPDIQETRLSLHRS